MDFEKSLIQRLKVAKRITVLTGAGISAESGIPTFRDAQTGLWTHFKPEELASPEAFAANPELVLDWYEWRRNLIKTSEPNLAHLTLVEMENYYPHFSIITQNVDGLHHKAGSKQVIELHGNIHRMKCSNENILYNSVEYEGGSYPRCHSCGGYLRPDVVWFGEALPKDLLRKAIEVSSNSEVFFAIGTSGLVEPAASLPYLALREGAICVEINLSLTPLTSFVQYFIQGNAAQMLPVLFEAIKS